MNGQNSDYLIRIVDDDIALLKALRLSLELDGWNVNTYNMASDFLDEDDNMNPGCLILDYQMPEMNGLELQQFLVDQGVSLPIVFLTAHAEVEIVIKAFREGAYDFLLKPVDPEALTASITKAIEKREKRNEALKNESPEALYTMLTEQQKRVARLVARGLTCAIIDERLGKSKRTIERHRGNVMRQLQCNSPEQLRNLLKNINAF